MQKQAPFAALPSQDTSATVFLNFNFFFAFVAGMNSAEDAEGPSCSSSSGHKPLEDDESGSDDSHDEEEEDDDDDDAEQKPWDSDDDDE